MVIKRCDNVEGLAGLATARTTEREREIGRESDDGPYLASGKK
jgi:hypothetical protein